MNDNDHWVFEGQPFPCIFHGPGLQCIFCCSQPWWPQINRDWFSQDFPGDGYGSMALNINWVLGEQYAFPSRRLYFCLFILLPPRTSNHGSFVTVWEMFFFGYMYTQWNSVIWFINVWFRIWEKGTNVLKNLRKIGEILITARWINHPIIRISPISQNIPSALVPFSWILIYFYYWWKRTASLNQLSAFCDISGNVMAYHDELHDFISIK